MKTATRGDASSTTPRGKGKPLAPAAAPSKTSGTGAFLYTAVSNNPEYEESGPVVETGIEHERPAFIFAVSLAAISEGSVYGVKMDGESEEEGHDVFAFIPEEPTSAELFLMALTRKLSADQFVTAHERVKWIATDLRGAEFIAYLRRVIDVADPEMVMVWPLGYYLGAGSSEAHKLTLLTETGWLIPSKLRYSSRVKPKSGAGPFYDIDPDYPQGDWWKSGGY